MTIRWWRFVPSLGMRGARGFRQATPAFHLITFAAMVYTVKSLLDEGRSDIYQLPPPPCDAPPKPPGVLSLTESMEMPWRTDDFKIR